MNLYLMQHGKPLSKEEDPDRPLSSQGVDDSRSIGAALKKFNLNINKILHSGKTRARQTAELVKSELNGNIELIETKGISPSDDVGMIVAIIQDSDEDTMIVGHLPHLAKLTSLLITGTESPYVVNYQQGCIVCLTRNEEKKWTVSWMITPGIV